MGRIKRKHTQEKQTAQNNQIHDRKQSKKRNNKTVKRITSRLCEKNQQDRQTLSQINEKTDRQYPDEKHQK